MNDKKVNNSAYEVLLDALAKDRPFLRALKSKQHDTCTFFLIRTIMRANTITSDSASPYIDVGGVKNTVIALAARHAQSAIVDVIEYMEVGVVADIADVSVYTKVAPNTVEEIIVSRMVGRALKRCGDALPEVLTGIEADLAVLKKQ